MSADADELLARAARAQERDEPTREELLEKLEKALDEIELKFPDGEPSDCDGFDLMRYVTLVSEIRSCRSRLERGSHAAGSRRPVRPVLSLVPPEGDEQWQAFVESHPELTTAADEPVTVVAPLTFTDEEVLAALDTAIRNDQRPWSRGATCAASVVCRLLPERETRAKSQASLMGKQLARLAREGKIVRLRAKWTKGRGKSAWSLHGLEIGEWWLAQYEVENA